MNNDIKFISWVIRQRNSIAKDRTLYRNRRRNYDKKPLSYKMATENGYNRAVKQLKELTKTTTLDLRRALKRQDAKLINDYNAGYSGILIFGDGPLGHWVAKTQISKDDVYKLAVEYEADLAVENIIKGA